MRETQTPPPSCGHFASILGSMDRLWTPWRYTYITTQQGSSFKGIPEALKAFSPSEDKLCVFCNMIAAVESAISSGMAPIAAERAACILQRYERCFVCLNIYPYSSGHLMVVPYRHCDALSLLDPETATEVILTAQQAEQALRAQYRPDGINMGLNLGEAAGAGVAEHLHLHILPRWFGDTNFMTVTAETRVLPEELGTTWESLKRQFSQQK